MVGFTMTRRLMEWADNDPAENYQLLAASVFVTLLAGIMSGLTLGLMSLDNTQMEVLLRSGTPKEKKYAKRISPIIKNSHHLLVTLLLCNAISMTTLPLFLDRLADPLTALLVSVTAVLLFGEIVPQAVCARYGLVIGARLAWLVRLLMAVTSPVSWTTGKLLDLMLGTEDHSLFRRQQLKALVDIHGEATGLGGKLSLDEIKVITGALDLTNKIAYRSMTPLNKIMMLSTDDKLDEATLGMLLDSGHSRIPVHRAGNRSDLVGLLLVKELLQYKMSKDVPVSSIKMRSLPRLSAATPMYDMLKLFQTGRSHMAVLTQPEFDDENDQDAPLETTEHQDLVESVAAAAIVAAEEETSKEETEQGSVAHSRSGLSHGLGPDAGPAPSRLQRDSNDERFSDVIALALASHVPHGSVAEGLARAGSGTGTEGRGRGGDGEGSVSGGRGRRVTRMRLSGTGSGSALRREASGSVGPGSSQLGSDLAAAVTLDMDEFVIEYEEDGGMEDEPVLYEDEAVAQGGGENGVPAGAEGREGGASRRNRNRVPKLASPGEPIGIITIEDVIEELIRAEIVDETDRWVDNLHTKRVEQAVLSARLPERLKQAVAGGTLPVDLMLKTSLGRRTMSRTNGLAAALPSLTAPLLPPSQDVSRS